MPVIVRDLDDDEAVLLMVDSNLQRETILPSERAFALKMKLDAMKRQAGRPTKENCSQVGNNLSKRSSELLAEEMGQSKNQIFRYTIGKEFAIPAGFSSSGIQAKYYKDGFWYKKNRDGNEGLAEQICSDILSFTNIQDYVPYEACRISGNAPSHTFGGRLSDTGIFSRSESWYWIVRRT